MNWGFPLGMVVCVLVGCSENQVYRNLYEGSRIQRDLETPPNEKGVVQLDLTYDQYRAERKRTLEGRSE